MTDQQETEARPYRLISSTGEERQASRGFTGQAKAEYPNGDSYEGGFENGVKHGQGKYTWVNGDIYEGGYKKDKKDGTGKMTYGTSGYYFGKIISH